jgi:DNA-binding response OmpR family regulator
MMLERAGYRVTSVISAARGIALCKRTSYDLLVLGHSLPQAEKQKLVAEFRKHCPAPIIALRRNHGEPLVAGADYQIQSDPAPLLALIAEIFKEKSEAAEA